MRFQLPNLQTQIQADVFRSFRKHVTTDSIDSCPNPQTARPSVALQVIRHVSSSETASAPTYPMPLTMTTLPLRDRSVDGSSSSICWGVSGNTTASEGAVERFLSHNVADVQWAGLSGFTER